MRMPPTHFLNVDLDLRGPSEAEVRELVRFLEPSALMMNLSGTFASLELRETVENAAEAIAGFVRVVRSLPPQTRALWDRCESRVMNVGIQSRPLPHAAVFELPP